MGRSGRTAPRTAIAQRAIDDTVEDREKPIEL
jgi:hypothetical protein